MVLAVLPAFSQSALLFAAISTEIDLYVTAVEQLESLPLHQTVVPAAQALTVAHAFHDAFEALGFDVEQLAPVAALVRDLEQMSGADPEGTVVTTAFVENLRQDWLLPLPQEGVREAAQRLHRRTQVEGPAADRRTTMVYAPYAGPPRHPLLRAWNRVREGFGSMLFRWGHRLRAGPLADLRRTVAMAAADVEEASPTEEPVAPGVQELIDPETRRLLVIETFKVGEEVFEGIALSDYKILKVAGEGAMGRVYKAIELGTGRRVAIKVATPPEPAMRQYFMNLFANEQRLQGTTETDRTVRVYKTGVTARGEPFIVMEYLDGGSLQDYIEAVENEERAFDLDEAVSFGLQAVAAVAEAQGLGIVHKDVKPDNFFVVGDRLKLGDFGIAERLSEIKQGHQENIRGTPLYIPLETWHGLPDTFRRDVYALGVVLYELLTGRMPYLPPEGAKLLALAVRMATGEPPHPPSQATAFREIPPALDRIVMKALALDPNERYADASELLFDFATYRAQALEEEARQYLQPSWSDRNERNRAMSAWRDLTEQALDEYQRAYERFEHPRIRHQILLLNLALHNWFDTSGLNRSRNRVAREILRLLERTPDLDREQRLSRTVRRAVQVQLQLERGSREVTPQLSLGRFVERDGVLEWDPESLRPLSLESLSEPLRLEWGPVHAIRVEGPGLYPIVIPLPVRPSREPHTVRIPLYSVDEIPSGFVVIPAGPVAVRNFPGLYGEQTNEWRMVDHDYAIGPKVTNAEWLCYLQEVATPGKQLPRHWDPEILRAILQGTPIRADDLKDRNGRPLHPRAAVTGVRYEEGLEYLAWHYPQQGARYTTLNEWKRAVRGNDVRTYTWGDALPTKGAASWRIAGDFAPSTIPPNAGEETRDVSPFSHFGAAGLEMGLRYLVSGSFTYIINDQPTLYLPAAGLHEVDPSNAAEVAKWALLVGQPYIAPSPTTIETLTADSKVNPQFIEMTGIVPVIPLRGAEPTPCFATLRQ